MGVESALQLARIPYRIAFVLHVTETCRRGAGTRRCSYRNRGNLSGTGSAVQTGHMIGCGDYAREAPEAAARSHPLRSVFATCTLFDLVVNVAT